MNSWLLLHGVTMREHKAYNKQFAVISLGITIYIHIYVSSALES